MRFGHIGTRKRHAALARRWRKGALSRRFFGRGASLVVTVIRFHDAPRPSLAQLIATDVLRFGAESTTAPTTLKMLKILFENFSIVNSFCESLAILIRQVGSKRPDRRLRQPRYQPIRAKQGHR